MSSTVQLHTPWKSIAEAGPGMLDVALVSGFSEGCGNLAGAEERATEIIQNLEKHLVGGRLGSTTQQEG